MPELPSFIKCRKLRLYSNEEKVAKENKKEAEKEAAEAEQKEKEANQKSGKAKLKSILTDDEITALFEK